MKKEIEEVIGLDCSNAILASAKQASSLSHWLIVVPLAVLLDSQLGSLLLLLGASQSNSSHVHNQLLSAVAELLHIN